MAVGRRAEGVGLGRDGRDPQRRRDAHTTGRRWEDQIPRFGRAGPILMGKGEMECRVRRFGAPLGVQSAAAFVCAAETTNQVSVSGREVVVGGVLEDGYEQGNVRKV